MEIQSAAVQEKTGLEIFRENSVKSPVHPDKSRPISNNSRSLDQVTISQEGKEKGLNPPESSGKEKTAGPTATELESLTSQDLVQLRTLKRRDLEVRSHEQAHLSTAGRYAKGGANFVYQKGPDGGSYAIGGEVGIDMSAEGNPEATITKMQTVKRAALAPLNPSSTDRNIAAQAANKELLARQQLIREQHEELLAGRSETKSRQIQDNKPSQVSAEGLPEDMISKRTTLSSTFTAIA